MSIQLSPDLHSASAPISIPSRQHAHEQSVSPPSDMNIVLSSSAPPLLSSLSSPRIDRRVVRKGLPNTLPPSASSSTSSLENLESAFKGIEEQIKELRDCNREKMRRRGRSDSVKRMADKELHIAEVVKKLPMIERWINLTKPALMESNSTLYVSRKETPQTFVINKKKVTIKNTTGYSWTITDKLDFILQFDAVFAGGTEAEVRYALIPKTMEHFVVVRREDKNYSGAKGAEPDHDPFQQVAGEMKVKELCKNFKYLTQPYAFRYRIGSKNGINVRYVYTIFPFADGGDLEVKNLSNRKFFGDIPHGKGNLDGPLFFKIAYGIAKSIQELHLNGLAHRDIKPENIVLHQGRAMLTDFGDVIGKEEFIVQSPDAPPPINTLRSGSLELIRADTSHHSSTGFIGMLKNLSRPGRSSMSSLPEIREKQVKPAPGPSSVERFLGKTRTTGGTEVYKPPEQAFSAHKLDPSQPGPVDKSFLSQVPVDFELNHPLEFTQKGDIFSYGVTLFQLFHGIIDANELIESVREFRNVAPPRDESIETSVFQMLKFRAFHRQTPQQLYETYGENPPHPDLAIYGLLHNMLISRVAERPGIHEIVNVLKGLKRIYPMPSSQPCSSTDI